MPTLEFVKFVICVTETIVICYNISLVVVSIRHIDNKYIRGFRVCAVANSDSFPKPLLLIPVTLTVYAVLEVRFSSITFEILDPLIMKSCTGSPQTVVKLIFQAVGGCVVLVNLLGC